MLGRGAASFSTADSPECVRKKGRENFFRAIFRRFGFAAQTYCRAAFAVPENTELARDSKFVPVEVVPRAEPAARRPAIFKILASLITKRERNSAFGIREQTDLG